jgi:hypothetical protein
MTSQIEDIWLNDGTQDLQDKNSHNYKVLKVLYCKTLKRMAQQSPLNVNVICEYIVAD